MEILILAVLFGALLALIALGVEDNRYHRNIGTANRLPVVVQTGAWSETLPTRGSLPWDENTAG